VNGTGKADGYQRWSYINNTITDRQIADK